MANTQNLKPFKKGDSRINRRGRPRKSDIIAQLSKTLLDEQVPSGPNHRLITRLEAILREWLDSGNFQKQLAVIHYAYGKIPDNAVTEDRNSTIIVNWGKTITSHAVYDPDEDRPSIFDDDEDDVHPQLIDVF